MRDCSRARVEIEKKSLIILLNTRFEINLISTFLVNKLGLVYRSSSVSRIRLTNKSRTSLIEIYEDIKIKLESISYKI